VYFETFEDAAERAIPFSKEMKGVAFSFIDFLNVF
jgi:hypothetical protein